MAKHKFLVGTMDSSGNLISLNASDAESKHSTRTNNCRKKKNAYMRTQKVRILKPGGEISPEHVKSPKGPEVLSVTTNRLSS